MQVETSLVSSSIQGRCKWGFQTRQEREPKFKSKAYLLWHSSNLLNVLYTLFSFLFLLSSTISLFHTSFDIMPRDIFYILKTPTTVKNFQAYVALLSVISSTTACFSLQWQGINTYQDCPPTSDSPDQVFLMLNFLQTTFLSLTYAFWSYRVKKSITTLPRGNLLQMWKLILSKWSKSFQISVFPHRSTSYFSLSLHFSKNKVNWHQEFFQLEGL